MNKFIGFIITEEIGNERPTPNKHMNSCHCEVDSQFYDDTLSGGTISCISLPREILETACLLFQKKGFEQTTITDICNRLDITKSHFYKFFESLDEILEILWAR